MVVPVVRVAAARVVSPEAARATLGKQERTVALVAPVDGVETGFPEVRRDRASPD